MKYYKALKDMYKLNEELDWLYVYDNNTNDWFCLFVRGGKDWITKQAVSIELTEEEAFTEML